MSRFLAATVLLLTAACSQQQKNNAPANQAEAAPAAEKLAPDLIGEWQVIKVDGRPLGQSAVPTATFEGGRAKMLAGCTRRAWTFTQDRNIVSFTANPAQSGNCERRPTLKEDAAFQALNQAKMVIFSKDGREASFSGDGGNVTLARR